jgi:spermidine synthase
MSERKYDVISIELTSIWFAGAGNLYNREFYELARAKMAPGGVLQQWVQMHHMRFVDLWVLLHTVRQVFPHAVLWLSGNQGQLIASTEPIAVNWPRLKALLADRANPYLADADRTFILKMVGQVVLDERAFDNLTRLDLSPYIGESLNAWLLGSDLLVSSDLRPYLEYNTPKGNALDLAELFNPSFLKKYGRTAPVVPFSHLPSDDIPLAGAIANIGRSDHDAARYWLEKSATRDSEAFRLVLNALESLEVRSIFRAVPQP